MSLSGVEGALVVVRSAESGNISDARQSPLVTIDLRYTKVTDAGLEILAREKRYREIILSGSEVTRAGVEKLRKEIPEAYIA